MPYLFRWRRPQLYRAALHPRLAGNLFGLFGRGLGHGTPISDQAIQRPVVLALVFQYLLEDLDTGFVGQLLELPGVFRDVMAFMYF